MVRSLYKMLLLAAVLLAAHADEDIEVEEVEGAERQLPSMLLYKKLTPSADFTVMSPINVTLTVFNKGPGKAHQIIVADDNWKSDKFIVVAGDNNFTLEYLEAGDSYSHDFTVKPIRKLYHRVRPAKMLYVLSPPSDAETLSLDGLTTHLSNSIGEMRVTPPKDNLEENLLLVGRCRHFCAEHAPRPPPCTRLRARAHCTHHTDRRRQAQEHMYPRARARAVAHTSAHMYACPRERIHARAHASTRASRARVSHARPPRQLYTLKMAPA
uniref:Translocon-associated protein subunit beta n=2 Tax=Chrysotila carterae TaxID=13221 RepID=A0A7S4F203_CHRCT